MHHLQATFTLHFLLLLGSMEEFKEVKLEDKRIRLRICRYPDPAKIYHDDEFFVFWGVNVRLQALFLLMHTIDVIQVFILAVD